MQLVPKSLTVMRQDDQVDNIFLLVMCSKSVDEMFHS